MAKDSEPKGQIQHSKRNRVPRKAREKSAVNLNNLAVMMEIIDSSISVESTAKGSQLKKSQLSKTNPTRSCYPRFKKEELMASSTLRLPFKGSKEFVTKQSVKSVQNGKFQKGRISHVMELEERRDLLSDAPADDPLGPDSFEHFQWINVKQELPDDLEYSKVTFTELPFKPSSGKPYEENIATNCEENTSATENVKVTEKVTDAVHGPISNNESNTHEEDDNQCFSDENHLDDDSSNSEIDWGIEAQELVSKEVSSRKRSKKIPQNCDLCNKKLSSKGALRIHKLKKHNEKVQFICDICGEKFDFQRELLKHRNSTHREEDGRFACESCGKRFSDYHNFLLHRKNHEADKSLTGTDSLKMFESNGSLKSHQAEEHKLPNTEVKVRLKNQVRNHTCDTCGRSFPFNCLLQDHINLHTGAKPYLCQECGRAFSQKATLKQHEKTHSEVRPFQCTDCPLGFYNRGDLTKHLRKHTGERPYTCEVCGEGFSRSTHLGVHRRTHTGERPYTCDVCGRGFTKRGDVVRHQRIHNGEFPYLCQVCGKSFRQSAQCANHIKSHHPDAPLLVAKNPNPYTSYQAPTHVMY